MKEASSIFATVAAELRALGIILTRFPGEYGVNFRHGSDAAARFADDLDRALELGRTMAAEESAAASPQTFSRTAGARR